MEEESTPTQDRLRTAASRTQAKWNIVRVYMIFLSGVLLSVFTIRVFSRFEGLTELVNKHFIVAMCATVLLIIINANIFFKIRYERVMWTKLVCWIVNCSLIVVPMLKVDAAELTKRFLYTLAVLVVASLSCTIMPKQFIELYIYRVPLANLHHHIALGCLLYTLLPHSLDRHFVHVLIAGDLLVYSALIVCNTHGLTNIAQTPQFDAVFLAFVLFMNASVMFCIVTVLVIT